MREFGLITLGNTATSSPGIVLVELDLVKSGFCQLLRSGTRDEVNDLPDLDNSMSFAALLASSKGGGFRVVLLFEENGQERGAGKEGHCGDT